MQRRAVVLNEEDRIPNGHSVMFKYGEKAQFGSVCGLFHRGPVLNYIVKTDRRIHPSYDYDCVVVLASAVVALDDEKVEIFRIEINGGEE
jgi:hypothetical protein